MCSLKNDDANCELADTDSEAARFLALCASQIGAAVDEAFCEIDGLSCAVLDSAQHTDTLIAVAKDSSPDAALRSERLEFASRELLESARTASARLQFVDRLEQRLLNVSKNLAGLARRMRSIEMPITKSEWSACLAASRATFTMEQERQMFDETFNTPAGAFDAGTGKPQEPVLFDTEANDEGC